jgi:hypothetical protein
MAAQNERLLEQIAVRKKNFHDRPRERVQNGCLEMEDMDMERCGLDDHAEKVGCDQHIEEGLRCCHMTWT